MKIEITPEEMLERFNIYGEIYLLLAPICEWDDMDGFQIRSYKVTETLDIEEGLFFQTDGEEVRFTGIEFSEDMLNILYTKECDLGEYAHPVIHLETESIRKVKSILEQYVKAISHE